MTIRVNTAAGGTAGTAATISNTGGVSGDAFDTADLATGGIWEFSSTSSHGTVGYRVQGTAARAYFGWNSFSSATATMSSRFYIRVPAAPSIAIQIFQVRSSTAAAGSINMTTGRALQVTDSAGGVLYTSNALTLDTWYRLEIAHEVGTSTTGKIWFAYYSMDSTTPVQTMFTSTNANLGTANLNEVRFGKLGQTGNHEMFIDSLKVDNATTSLLGPHIVSVASLRPAATVSNPGSWSEVGGAGSAAAALADELNTTYITTGANPSAAAITFSMNGTLDTGPVTVKVKADIDTSVAGTVDVALMQGTTVIATRQFSVTTTISDFQFTTTTSETSAITDRSDLRIRLTGNQT